MLLILEMITKKEKKKLTVKHLQRIIFHGEFIDVLNDLLLEVNIVFPQLFNYICYIHVMF